MAEHGEALEELDRVFLKAQARWERAEADRDRLAADCARLREALQRVIDAWQFGEDGGEIARAALAARGNDGGNAR